MSGIPTKGVAFTWQFKLVDAIDFATPETGKVATITISKDGGGFAAADNSASEIGFGWYEVVFTATEMTADRVAFIATAAGTAQTDENFYLDVAASIWEAARADHATAGSMGEVMNDLFKINTGRWRIDKTSNQLYFYDDDDSTVIYTFDLKDADGEGSVRAVWDRVPA
jgi:hypothetical protein